MKKIGLSKIFILFLFFLVLGSGFFLKDRVIDGEARNSPDIFISTDDDSFGFSGVIAITSEQEPVIYVGGQQSGDYEIKTYKASKDVLLRYLNYGEDNKQINKIDTSGLELLGKESKSIKSGWDEKNRVLLPLAESGVYYVEVSYGGKEVGSIVVRSKTGVIVEEGDKELVFWGQDFKSKRSINSGQIVLYNLEGGISVVEKGEFENDGVVKLGISEAGDVAIINRGDDLAIVPVNLQTINYDFNYRPFGKDETETKYFIFVDRPLYKPGDKLYFRSVIREDDDANYSLPTGKARVSVYESGKEDEPFYESDYQINEYGTINGEVELPGNGKGTYYLKVKFGEDKKDDSGYGFVWENNTVSFTIEEYRKPEYTVSVDSDKNEYINGERAKITIKGKYFSGQLLSNGEVEVVVMTGDYYDYSYYSDKNAEISDDFRYGYWGTKQIRQTKVRLNDQGEAEIDLPCEIPSDEDKSQVFSVEVSYKDESQNQVSDRKNILVWSGEYGIFKKDNSGYSGVVGEKLEQKVILVPRLNEKLNVGGIDVEAEVERNIWVKKKDPKEKYDQYEKVTEKLESIKGKTNNAGEVSLNMVPKSPGSYVFKVKAKDQKGNTVIKEFYSWVKKDGEVVSYDQGDKGITVLADKTEYKIGEEAEITVMSTINDRDVFLGFERGRLRKYQVVSLDGNEGKIKMKIEEGDIPNIYAKASSFSKDGLDTDYANLSIDSESKKLNVSIKTDRERYGPADTIKVNIETKDYEGKPIEAEIALWAVDKAIYELVPANTDNIFEAFWRERGDSTSSSHSLTGIFAPMAERGGCFDGETKVLMADGKEKEIKDIKTGDEVLTRRDLKSNKIVRARVSGVHKDGVAGWLIINGNLKVSVNHYIYVGGTFKQAGSVQIGDKLIDENGDKLEVESLEWIKGKYQGYNLEIGKYKSFFADGILVHNEKGEARENFSDLAYWNAKIVTDKNGKAEVSFKLPDNLTTWVFRAVGVDKETVVGEVKEEVVVSKVLILRPVLPNILRTGDEAILSAVLENYSGEKKELEMDFEFEGGKVLSNKKIEGIEIDDGGKYQGYWKTKVEKEKEGAKFTFSGWEKENDSFSDTVIEKMNIVEYGYYIKEGEVKNGPGEYRVKLSEEEINDKTEIKLYLSPTLIGNLESGVNYLVSYPYGCTEQITSSLVGAILVKTTPGFARLYEDRDKLDFVLKKAVVELKEKQNYDGSWSWWNGREDLFVTIYTLDTLVWAEKEGIEVEEGIFEKAKYYLENLKTKDNREKVLKSYGLNLLLSDKAEKVTNFDGLTSDYLAYAVMTNYMLGENNSQVNGAGWLVDRAIEQGEAVFWEKGDKKDFGSDDASTALSVRALKMVLPDDEVVLKGVRYLARNRKNIYWSNTFGTANVMRVLTGFWEKETKETNYTFQVEIDGKVIKSGVCNQDTKIGVVEIKAKDIKKEGSRIKIVKDGLGDIYSALVVNKFEIDRSSEKVENGISIKREYINEDGDEIRVGDRIKVRLIVDGLKAEEDYAVIDDKLPAGMVPINMAFKGEQVGKIDYKPYWVEYEKDGAVLHAFKIAPGKNVFEYEARVVTEGNFGVPPARVELMYTPEIYGLTKTGVIEIKGEAKLSFLEILGEKVEIIKKIGILALIVGVPLVVIGVVSLFIVRKIKRKKTVKTNSEMRIEE